VEPRQPPGCMRQQGTLPAPAARRPSRGPHWEQPCTAGARARALHCTVRPREQETLGPWQPEARPLNPKPAHLFQVDAPPHVHVPRGKRGLELLPPLLACGGRGVVVELLRRRSPPQVFRRPWRQPHKLPHLDLGVGGGGGLGGGPGVGPGGGRGHLGRS
jgi:hypothetical protein